MRFPFFRERAHDVFRRDVAQLPLADQTPLLLEVSLPWNSNLGFGVHVSILQLAPVTQDPQGRLRRAGLVIPLVAPRTKLAATRTA